ncbi:GNAT family protein [Micromonospora sp. NPDC007271]|uniref:GNAT family N-acetyltransferase n=1 Tax=Micromonospora sp. NPDC007271 TaxID=3154587 RepID=UPI0033E73192
MIDLALPIRTERLLLRQYRVDDVDALLAYYGDPLVARYVPWEPWSREHAAEQVAKRVHRLGITRIDSALALLVEHKGEVVGDVVLWPTDETLSRGEVGWVFHPSMSGRGFATEAVRALIGVAFEHCDMHRVIARLDARNEASARLCQRVGMVKEAHLRQDYWMKGEWADTLIYGLLAEQWPG